MKWTQLQVTCSQPDLETVCAVMSMIDVGLMIEDYSDIENNLTTEYGEFIDEKLLKIDRSIANVSVYVPEEKSIADAVAFLRERFNALLLDVKIELVGMNEDDWANAWKKDYKTLHIGNRTVINPPWITYEPQNDEIVVQMDPGMAFGTGTHETTRLVIRIMQDVIKGGERVLDVGTGSGILSICASKLGAKECFAYDIDPVAVKVARENAKDDGCDNITVGVSDLLAGVDLSGGKYDFCVANIVADIIIRMMPDISDYLEDGAPLILSGIIDQRADEVRDAVRAAGFRIVREEQENDWLAIMARRS